MNNDDFNKEDFNGNDEKELDSLFDDLNNTKFKKAMKKAKWHSVLRNILISLLVIVVVMAGGSIINRGIVYRMERNIQIAVDEFNLISAPNKYIGEVSRYHGVLGGKNEYTTYKIIEGKVVYTGEGQYNYGMFRNYYGNCIGVQSPSILGTSYDSLNLKMQRYNNLGQREMVFFYPFISYPEYKNDLRIVENIESDKIAEMALSFNKEYSIDEVKKMLPNDVTLSWYWIDDINEEEKRSKKLQKIIEDNSDKEIYHAAIRSEKTVYGIKAYNDNGEPIEKPEEDFFRALRDGIKYNTSFKGEFERVYNNIVGKDGRLNKDNIKVFGAVVTGNRDSLEGLRGLPFIKASSLGVVIEKY